MSVDEMLADAAIDYLFVASEPQTIVQAGDRYEYSIIAKSSTGSVSLSLESGPEGASLSADGQLSWQAESMFLSASFLRQQHQQTTT